MSRSVEATQGFMDGESKRCPRCLAPLIPEEWREHMLDALMGGCKLQEESNGEDTEECTRG